MRINGVKIDVFEGTNVAVALLGAGIFAFRSSVSGQLRGPLCAIGVCMECRVTIDGKAHQLACQTLCRDGMEVETT